MRQPMWREPREMVSRSCQTEVFITDENITKVYFRIVFEGRTLQFKLPLSSALAVMFAKVPVIGDFIWHGIVLDSSLTPAHYNMLSGEENCVTLHVVLNNRRGTTYADEAQSNDAVRAASFRLRLQEEENDALRVEVDELRAQIFGLHRELSNVVDINAKRAEEERNRRDDIQEKNTHLQAALRRLESEHELLKRRSAVRDGMADVHRQAHSTATPKAALSTTQLDVDTSFVRIHCVLMDESSEDGQELSHVQVTEPATVAAALECVLRTHAGVVPPMESSMVCVRSARTGEFVVIDLNDGAALTAPILSDDTLYIAKMNQ